MEWLQIEFEFIVESVGHLNFAIAIIDYKLDIFTIHKLMSYTVGILFLYESSLVVVW